jgi:Zyg-11 family protein
MSGCGHRDGMDEFMWLPKYLKNTLVYLVLHNVGEIDSRAIKNIIKLNKLRHLDISKLPDDVNVDHYTTPNIILKMIVEGLPDLSSLDISATNLAGNGVFEYEQNQKSVRQERNNESTDSSGSDQEDSNNVEVTLSKSKVIERGEMPKCDIVGLTSRVDKPLDFLGLYKCVYEPNHRIHIPAKQVCSQFK